MSERWTMIAGGVLCVLLLAAGGVVLPHGLLRGWLAAGFLASSLPTGALFLLMLIHLIPGRWGFDLSLPLEAVALTLPIGAIALLPVLIGMGALYPWTAVAPAGFQAGWLSPVPFVIRTILWFAGLHLCLWALVRRRGSAQTVSIAGLIFIVFFGTLIAIDWLLSPDPAFHNSAFGLQALSIAAGLALPLAILIAQRLRPETTGANGALLLTLSMLWVYCLYMPFLIAWSNNYPDAALWYGARSPMPWNILIALAVAIHVLLFLILLFPGARRSRAVLDGCAIAMMTGQILYVGWIVLPADPEGAGAAIAFLIALIGLGLLHYGAVRLMLARRLDARIPQEALSA